MADAVAVRADQHAFNTIRQARAGFAHHFVIVDAVDGRFRCVQRQLVNLLVGQEGVLDFNQIFTAHLARRQVQADGDALVGFGQFEQGQQLKAHLRRDMVNYGATFNGFDLEFVIVCHGHFPLQS